MNHDALVLAAQSIQKRAHAPYSGFHVGAAVLDEKGQIHPGVNIENAAYTGSHAEYGAVGAMIAAGGKRILAIAVHAEGRGRTVVTPCGGCRQHLAEFGAPETIVILTNEDGYRVETTLGALLPMTFSLSNFENGK